MECKFKIGKKINYHFLFLLLPVFLTTHSNGCNGQYWIMKFDGVEESVQEYEIENELQMEQQEQESPQQWLDEMEDNILQEKDELPSEIESFDFYNEPDSFDSNPQPDVPVQPDTVSEPIVDLPAEEMATGVCSGHGTQFTWSDGTFCACDAGYTPSSPAGTDCVPTESVCTGGPIPSPIDTDGDGRAENEFWPSELECLMFELVNRTRASHDNEGSPECHSPLLYNREWSAHGRQHSRLMFERGALFHDDFPYGQNCAYGCSPECEMNMYMSYPGEDHCPDYSHHCNIMNCRYSQIGIGYWTPEEGTWNTQNFL